MNNGINRPKDWTGAATDLLIRLAVLAAAEMLDWLDRTIGPSRAEPGDRH